MTSKVSTGVAGLDSILKGGLPEGRVVLVLGEPGAGKTILCSQFLHQGAADGRRTAVFVGMNEPKSRFMTEMAEFGMDFAKLESAGSFAYVDATEIRTNTRAGEGGPHPCRRQGARSGEPHRHDPGGRREDQAQAHSRRLDLGPRYSAFPLVEERRPVVLDMVETLQSSGATTLAHERTAFHG